MVQPDALVAVDPGITTGWAWVTMDGVLLKCGQLPDCASLLQWGPRNLHTAPFWRALQAQRTTHLVVEDFIGGGLRDQHINNTLKLVGFFVALGHSKARPPMTVKLQVPQIRTPHLSAAETLTGLTRKGPDRHSVDATAHALAYLYRQSRLT